MKDFVRCISFLSFLGALFFAAGCSRETGTQGPDGTDGAVYFKGYGCPTCHRMGGEGGPDAPDLTYVGFRKSPEWLDLWLKSPRAWKSDTAMPNFDMPDKVRRSLVAYLSKQKGEAYRLDPPWNAPGIRGNPVKRGSAIFDRVGCRGCHGRNGEGGYPNNNVIGGQIPSLAKMGQRYSKEEIKNKIRAGSQPAKAESGGPEPMIRMPKWGDVLSEDEIDSLADYLISLKPQGSFF